MIVLCGNHRGGRTMADILVDCQGLPCPQPVLECKRCIEEGAPDSFTLLVDNDAARENVSRFASTKGYRSEAEKLDTGLWRLTLSRGHSSLAAPPAETGPREAASTTRQGRSSRPTEQICVFIGSRTLGRGDETLGARLMVNFVSTLPELGQDLWRIIMVNEGVTLATTNSPVLETLLGLEASGVGILVCGTCLDFFQLLEQKQVGQTTNMLDVVTSLQLATKVIRP